MKVAILGAGITGIAIAKEFPEAVIIEKETAGGLLRSTEVQGFTFDVGGHLFHFRDEELRREFEITMKGNYLKLKRKAVIYLMDEIIPYPFQANFYPLPQRVKMECLRDFVNAFHSPPEVTPGNFEEWLLKTFGEAMCRYFFFPYNRKFWGIDLKKVSHQWAEWAIPRPSIEEIYLGSQGKVVEGMGYNPEFYYPEKGGAYAFFKEYARGIKIKEKTTIREINLENRIIYTDKGEIPYDVIFSTIPLVELVKLIKPEDDILLLASRILKANPVTVFNIGFEGEVPEYHWIYFPEEKYQFFRLGFYSNFSPFMAPRGFHSLYLEFSGKKRNESDLKEAIKVLNNTGLIRGEIKLFQRHYIPYAYPIPTREAALIKDGLESFLDEKNIFIAGRAGSWEYLSTEGAILSGKGAVKKFRD